MHIFDCNDQTGKPISALLLLLLCGCATQGLQPQIAAYKDCVDSQAMGMIDSSKSADDIALLASAQCQANLAVIKEKLREKNLQGEDYIVDADGFTEKLRERTNAEVAARVRAFRGE